MGAKPRLSHLDAAGRASMVSVTQKPESARRAVACAWVTMMPSTVQIIESGGSGKGDVLGTARIAGIQATKSCATLIPLCHPLRLTSTSVEFRLNKSRSRVEIRCVVEAFDRSGVEMEALMGASLAALTIYDMCKAVDREIVIHQVCLLEKQGGKTGFWKKA